jgi:hypothetical protein
MSFVHVPLLLQVSDAVIHRLDIVATRAFDPPGSATSGVDDAFREPVPYDTTEGSSIADRVTSRVELTAIRVPCQVETDMSDSLHQAYQGNLQRGEYLLVFSVVDLQLRSLIDASTGKPTFGVGDRVSALEKHNLTGVNAVLLPQEGMFFREMRPASWGFGESFDLWLGIITNRDKASF